MSRVCLDSRAGRKRPAPPSAGARCYLPDIEESIEPVVLAAFGDMLFPEFIDLPAEDHAGELARVQESIADLEADRYERGLFKGEAGAQRYAAMMTKLETRLDVLRAQPQLPARREVILSNETFRERWESLESDHERGALLRRMHVRLLAFKDERGRTRMWLRQERPGSQPSTPYQDDWGPVEARDSSGALDWALSSVREHGR